MVVGLPLITTPKKSTFISEFADPLELAWFTTRTWLEVCWTACTGTSPTLATPSSVSPETLTTITLPGLLLPLLLMETTVWLARGSGNAGGFGMMMGRKVSPHPAQIASKLRASPTRKDPFIHTPLINRWFTETVIVSGIGAEGEPEGAAGTREDSREENMRGAQCFFQRHRVCSLMPSAGAVCSCLSRNKLRRWLHSAAQA